MIPTRYINAGPAAATASAGPAMAAGQATEAIGNAIAQIGETGLAVVGKIRQTKEAGAIIAFMAQADETAGRFSIELARRSDTEAWPKEWQDQTTKLREQGQALGLSPEGMARLDQEFTGWSSTRAIHFETQAATKALGIAKSQTTQSLEYYISRGDREGYDRTMRTAKDGGILNPAEEQQADAQFAENAARLDLDRAVEGDPQSVIDTPEEAFLKRVPGLTPDLVRRAKDAARGKVKELAFDSVETAQDEIVSGKITDPRQIDENPRYAGLRPMVREKLKRGLADFQAQKAYGLMNSPEAQQQVIGKVSSLLSTWEPKAAEDADVKYAEIAGLIGQLPEGSMQTELMRQAKAIRTGAWAESTSHADAAMKALDAAAKEGRFGKAPPDSEPQSVKRLLDAGFLSSVDKLKSLGLSTEAAQGVAEAAGSEKDPIKKHSAQLKALRALAPYWNQRGTPTASGFDQAAAEAMLNGADSVKYTSPEAEDAAISAKMDVEKKVGEAKQRLNDFLRLNPKATPAEIDDKIREIGGEQTMRKLKGGIYDGKKSTSGGPAGASDATASVPVGKNLTEIVKNFEAGDGFHSKAYWDYGQWSIGYGTKAKEGEVIDQAEADKRLASELGSHRSRVEAEAAKTGLKFTPAEIDALTSFDFNTGRIETLLAGGSRTKREIADTMLLYRNAGGERLRGLENRRKAERHLFLYGHADQPTATAQNTGDFSEFNVIQ